MRSGSAQRPPGGRNNGNRPFPQQQRTPQRGQTFDSNGPNIRIRGSAHQIFERYVALAREATIGDDRVAVENFYQPGFPGWIGPTGPKAPETLAELPVPSFTRRVRRNSAT